MTALDVRASVEEMRSHVIGLRLLNVYDLNPKMFLFRFGHGENKKTVLLENGVRFHLTEFSREKPQIPSQFTLKLRKHIRSWRLDSISQLENDRTVDLCFGVTGTESCFHIIIELFSRGNIILTDHQYTILVLLRSHKDDDVKIAVRETYPSHMRRESEGFPLHEWHVNERSGKLEICQLPLICSAEGKEDNRSNAITEEQANKEVERRTTCLRESWLAIYERNAEDETFKSTLAGVHHFGPGLAEHILTLSNLPPNKKKKDNTERTAEELFEIMLPHMLTSWDITDVQLPPGGYLLKLAARGDGGRRSKKKTHEEEINKKSIDNDRSIENKNETHKDPSALKEPCQLSGTADHKVIDPPLVATESTVSSSQTNTQGDKPVVVSGSAAGAGSGALQTAVVQHAVQYDDFSPILLSQFEASSALSDVLYLPSFGEVCDRFFLPTEVNKIEEHNDKKKNTALNKIEKFERDHLRRLTKLQQEQERYEKLGEALIAKAEKVDEAISLINGALALGTQWNKLKSLVNRRQEEGHPIAYMIHDLFLERNVISVLLEDSQSDEKDENHLPPLVVEVSLAKSAHANAADYFGKKKFALMKLGKTIAAKEIAEAGAARKGERQAAKQKAKKKLIVERKRGWWEKFNWFRTSTGDVALQGKDQQTTEILVRRIMQLGDLFVHCDAPHAFPCLLRPSKIIFGDSEIGAVLHSEKKDANNSSLVLSQSLEEVGGWCISRSGAWQRKQVTSAWWIYASQITGGSAVGSYLYEGERHFIPPQPLSLGFGLLFCVDRGAGTHEHHSNFVGGEAAAPKALQDLHEIGENCKSTSCAQKGGDYYGEDCLFHSFTVPARVGDVPPDSATSLHPLPTVEELRVEQRKHFSTGDTPALQLASDKKKREQKERKKMLACGSRGKGTTDNNHQLENRCNEKSLSLMEEKKQQILQGNLTKRQRRKLQKIRTKFGDQDEKERMLAAKGRGNPRSLVEALLEEHQKTPAGLKKSSKKVTFEVGCTRFAHHQLSVDNFGVNNNDSEEDHPITGNPCDEEGQLIIADEDNNTNRIIENQTSGEISINQTDKRKREETSVILPSREAITKKMTQELADALSHYTLSPRPGDYILHILGVCAPFLSTLNKYPFRVELIAGGCKKGQVASEIIAQYTRILQKIENEGMNTTEAHRWIVALKDDIRSHLERLEPTEIIEQLRSDAKVR